MNTDFNKMTSEELCEYACSYDFQTYRDIDPKDLKWSYIPKYSIDNINIPTISQKEDWIEWINKEQEIFASEMSYDRYAEVEEYWIPNPYEEPIIMIRYLDGTNDISDGWHRTGLAFKNNFKTIPVVMGTEKNM